MKYIFIHIGKTAGTSFRTFLESNVSRPYWGYGKTYVLTHEDLDTRDPGKFTELEPNGHAVFEYFDLFSEHAPFGLHRYLKTKEYQYIAVLREPVKRTISAYRYAIDRGWITEDVNIIDWFFMDENKDKKHYQLNYCSGVPIDAPAEVKLDKGLKNIKDDKFLFGFTERYDEFIDLCCTVNNWKPQYKTTNVTKAKKEVAEEDKEKLKELLTDEIKFYDEAVKIYNEKYKSFIKND
jgi:hypothetical protein